jgi:hypothetical protein
MKKVLAELHNVITSLEDDGMLKEASMLQNVFVRIASDPYQKMTDEEFSEAERDNIIEDYAIEWALKKLHDPSYKEYPSIKDPSVMRSDEDAVKGFMKAVNFVLKNSPLTDNEAKEILNAKVNEILAERERSKEE